MHLQQLQELPRVLPRTAIFDVQWILDTTSLDSVVILILSKFLQKPIFSFFVN